MASVQTAVLLLAVIFSTLMENGYGYNPYTRVSSSGGCYYQRCGYNAKCTVSEGRPVCSCNNLHIGDPLVQCEKVECVVNEDCPLNKACINNRCADACAGTCGFNALCDTKNHVPVCYCPPGYTGDPFTSCVIEDPCKSKPCGENTKCEVVNSVPVCSCLPGYIGKPLSGCRHECESDSECPQDKACSSSFRCENPCKCGQNANCEVSNHKGRCTCPPNWQGNPYVTCQPECTYDSDCPGGKPVCYFSKCVNPCDAAPCGVNANCELRGTTAVCSCPKHMTGNPFEACRPFTPEDLCKSQPCGINAKCTPGHDNTGEQRPVCTCLEGYIGNALTKCQPGECFTDNECPNNKACIDYFCQNPCTGHECAASAVCEPRNHIAVCTCPDGTRGDAVVTCNPIVGTRFNNHRSLG